MGRIDLTFPGTVKQFSKVVVAFYPPISNVRIFQWRHILANMAIVGIFHLKFW